MSESVAVTIEIVSDTELNITLKGVPAIGIDYYFTDAVVEAIADNLQQAVDRGVAE